MNELTRTSQASIVEPLEEQAIAVPRPSAAEGEGLLPILWRRRWIVVACIALALTVSLVYLSVAQPLYTSTARLYVQQIGPQLLASESQNMAPRDESYLFVQAEFLRSSPIIDPVIARPEIRSMQRLQGVENPLVFLKKELDVSVGKRDKIINVSFDAPDPAEAAGLVNAIVDSYISYSSGENRSTATEQIKVLRKQKEALDAELAAKATEIFEYKIANGTLSFESDRGNVIMQRLDKLWDAQTDAGLAVLTAKSNYEAARSVGLSASKMRRLIEAQHIDSGGVAGTGSETEEREARADISRMEMQLALVGGRYGKDHPSVRSLRQALEQRKAQIEQRDREFCEAYLTAVETTLRIAEQKARAIGTQVEAQEQQARDLNAKAAKYTKLQSERSRLETFCDSLDNRIKQLIIQSGGTFNIRILEPAQPSEKPSKPSKRTALAAGLLLGLVLGVVLAVIQEARDERLRSADEIQAMLGLPLLGVVPHMNGWTTPIERGQMVHLQPMSAAAEAYRTLRTAVHFGAAGGKAKTLLFTSPAPEDGKSTAASNLAIAMAQAGRKVLMLDADCRRPMQHVIFGLGESRGFCSLLGGGSTPEQAIRPTGIENLDILPCGPIPPNPAEILNSELFVQMLSALQESYDHVVIDSPPVGAVTDAQILGAIADVSILVLRAQSSTRQEARYARDRLLSVGGRLLGVVVNDVPNRPGSKGYYHSYGSYGRAGLPARGSGNAQLPAAASRSGGPAMALSHDRREGTT